MDAPIDPSPSLAVSPAGAGHASEAGGQAPEAGLRDHVADGIERQLDPRLVALDRLIGRIVAAATAVGSAAAVGLGLLLWPTWVTAGAGAGGLLLTGGLLWLAQSWPAVEHRHARYTVDTDGIEIHSGVFWRSVLQVTRSRVQHTDVSQGPLERRFGLGTLVLFTAGSDHAKVELRGLDFARAQRIREHLSPRGGTDGV
jgi:membrane protein YdbS with pleckstrin-like domain